MLPLASLHVSTPVSSSSTACRLQTRCGVRLQLSRPASVKQKKVSAMGVRQMPRPVRLEPIRSETQLLKRCLLSCAGRSGMLGGRTLGERGVEPPRCKGDGELRCDRASNGRTAMRRTLCLLSLLGLLLGVATHNLGAAPEQRQRSALADVAALDKPITYTETRIPLGELVQKVAVDTGVPLTADRDVADEPVAVVVKEMPARELLEQLADLLDYRWSPRQKSDEAKDRPSEKAKDLAANARGVTAKTPAAMPTYVIWQDLPSKQREEALRRAALGDVEKRFQETLKRYLEVAAMSPDQIQALEKYPQQQFKELEKLSPEERQAFMTTPEMQEKMQRANVARQLALPLPRALAGLLSRLTTQQWAVLREDRTLTLSTDPQPGELRLPAETARTFREAQPVMYPPGVTVRFSDPNGEEQMRQREKQMQEQWAAATGYQVTLRLDADPSRTRGSMFLSAQPRPIRSGAPNSQAGMYFGGGMGSSLSVGVPPVDFRRQTVENTPQRREELEKDPVVGVKLPFKPEAKPQVDPFGPGSGTRWRLVDLLPDLARTYDVQILADAYSTGSSLGTIAMTPAPTALFTLLDRYTQFSHRWDRRGRLIRLRSRTWFLDRPREIPLRLVREWTSLQEQQGGLSFDDYVKMATTLTDTQLNGLTGISEELRNLNLYEVPRARHALRLYATFNPAQRQQLWQGGVLTVAQMTPVQRSHFLASLQETNRGRPQPIRLDQWAGGSFSLSEGTRFTRIVEKRGGSTLTRMEPVDPRRAAPGARPPGAPVAAPVPRVADATQTTAAPTAPAGGSALPPQPIKATTATASVSRFPVTLVVLKLQYAPEQEERVTLTVAERH
jgi:hypothetical protein